MEIHKNGNGHNLLPPADWDLEIQKLESELANERERNLRTLADFKNYRRRIEREGSKIAEESKRELILPLLDIVDDLEKALQWVDSGELSSVKGIEIIHQKFLALLQTHGVTQFISVGTPFNPALHEAVAMVKQNESESGTIIDELRRGYYWNKELLRAAQVRVAGW